MLVVLEAETVPEVDIVAALAHLEIQHLVLCGTVSQTTAVSGQSTAISNGAAANSIPQASSLGTLKPSRSKSEFLEADWTLFHRLIHVQSKNGFKTDNICQFFYGERIIKS